MSSSPILTYLATITFSFCVGYFSGTASALPISRVSGQHEAMSHEPNPHMESEEPVLGAPKAASKKDCKLGSPVLAVRGDLGMSSGKIAVQCSHATLACYKALKKSDPSLLSNWEMTGQTKIVLRCEDEEELLLLEALAQSLGLCACSIQDAGKTQIPAGSRTVVGIGPGPIQLVNQVTNELRLW